MDNQLHKQMSNDSDHFKDISPPSSHLDCRPDKQTKKGLTHFFIKTGKNSKNTIKNE